MSDYLKEIENWRNFISTKGTSQNYNWSEIFPEFQIPNDKLILEDVPDPNHCSLDQINAFALTFNAYNDEEFKFKPGVWKESFAEKESIEEEYSKYEKHKDSLKYLRAILFYCQRAEHMSGPSDDYLSRMKKIIIDIRLLLKK